MHCIRVLRQKIGDKVLLMDGNGTLAKATILSDVKTGVELKIDSVQFVQPSKRQLHIAISPTKSNDRIEWFLEKATEFNVSEVTFLQTDHSERKKINLDRFKKIVLSAAKQSQSAYLPKLNELCPMKNFIKNLNCDTPKYIATLIAEEKSHFEESMAETGNKLVLIGPEGGFSQREVNLAEEFHIKPILLGHKRLRTETAGVFVASIHYFKNK